MMGAGRPQLNQAGAVKAAMRAKPIKPGEEQIVAVIRERIRRPGASKEVAYELGISRSHLLSIANGNARIGRRVAAKFGFRPAWERILLDQADQEDYELARKIEAELNRPSKLKEME